MSGVSEIPAYAVMSAAAGVGKRNKKRKKRADGTKGSAGGGWKRLDMEDMQIEGFEDGSVFEIEELNDYTLQTSESGGKILVFGNGKGGEEETKKKRKKRAKKSKAEKASDEDDNDDADGDEMEMIEAVDDDTVEGDEVDEEEVEEDDEEEEERDDDPKEDDEEEQDDDDEEDEEEVDEEEDEPVVDQKPPATKAKKAAATPEPVKPVALPKWDKYKLHPLLRQSLHRCGFHAPTPIQEKTIYPAVIDNRDVVGAAPTGSGKTLAFGLPILSQLLYEREQPGYVKDCKALILTPTRELALQIQQHLEKMVPNREVGIMTLVGGMSVQKQKRLLTYAPEIVIGTPGRLWDLIDSSHRHFADLHETLRFFVIDEADRMLQTGSYPEVEKIFEVVKKSATSAKGALKDLSDDEEESDDEDGDEEEDEETVGAAKVIMLDDVLRMHKKNQQQEAEGHEEEEDDDEDGDGGEEEESVVPARRPRQTFLFSATLTIPEGGRFHKGIKKQRNALTVLEKVMKRVGLRGRPAVVDLSVDDKGTREGEGEQALKRKQANAALSLPAGLELCQHEITDDNRDSYLYYFLMQYPGKTIVFLNAIHQVRRLAGLLGLLKLPVFALHAEMQQRQRLKKLDGFRANPKGILIATDVAARGLDIPSVDYVVHYHIARSTEVFLHRSGRTARANREGLSISLVSPADTKYHLQICKLLQRPTGLSDFPFDHRYLPAVDERMRLATAINDHENVSGKAKSEATWFSQMAQAADLDMDENLLSELSAKKQKGTDARGRNGESVEAMRRELARLVAEPLRPIGSVRKFRQLYQELGAELTADGEYRKRHAGEDLEAKAKKSYKRFRRRK